MFRKRYAKYGKIFDIKSDILDKKFRIKRYTKGEKEMFCFIIIEKFIS